MTANSTKENNQNLSIEAQPVFAVIHCLDEHEDLIGKIQIRKDGTVQRMGAPDVILRTLDSLGIRYERGNHNALKIRIPQLADALN